MGLNNNNKDNNNNKKSSKEKKVSYAKNSVMTNKDGGKDNNNNNNNNNNNIQEQQPLLPIIKSPTIRKTIAKRQKVPTPPKIVQTSPEIVKSKKGGSSRQTVDSGGSNDKIRKRKPKRTFKLHIYKVLKEVHRGQKMRISKRGMAVVNNYIEDFFERIAAEAGKLCKISKKQTLSLRDMQSAAKIVLMHGDLHLHALNEGRKVIKKIEMEGKGGKIK